MPSSMASNVLIRHVARNRSLLPSASMFGCSALISEWPSTLEFDAQHCGIKRLGPTCSTKLIALWCGAPRAT